MVQYSMKIKERLVS